LFQDGSFELGTGSTSPWAQASTNFGTPLCDPTSCGSSGARTGSWWAWFGGTTSAETGSVTQTGVIPTGTSAIGLYLYWRTQGSTSATFKVYVDGTAIYTLTGANYAPYKNGYTFLTINVSAYANNGSHTVKFEEVNPSGSTTNLYMDDVSLVTGTVPTATATTILPTATTIPPTATKTSVPPTATSTTISPTATAISGGLFQDGSFELGTASTSPWVQDSTNFGTPLCDSTCGVSGARTGNWWVWFGGTTSAETGSVSQTGVIPTGAQNITLYLYWTAQGSTSSSFKVFMDGTAIFTLTGAQYAAYSSGYTKVTLNIAAYANNGTHTVKFQQSNPSGSITSIYMDDVSLN
jgi:hypothetical protein